MKALLLVAHGSRRAESNQEIQDLAERLASRLSDKPDAGVSFVQAAYLELAEPLIPDGIERCIARGATSISVVPYFLARGTHVVNDIPEQVAIKQAQYPDMDIQITDYLGTSSAMVDVLLTLAR